MQAVGLRTYVWNNNLKSVGLLIAFPLVLSLVAYAVLVLAIGYGGQASLDAGLVQAAGMMPVTAPVVFAGAGLWYGVAAFSHQTMIDASTGARAVTRASEPALYNLLENLCISRGLAMPSLRVIETDARNAYATGLNDASYSITVTRGLMDALDEGELEAVLAHELTHIRNKDVRLLVIAAVFVGVIAFVAEIAFRGMTRVNLPRSDRHRRGGGGNAAALVIIALAILAFSYGLAILLRFALSRRREYLADAGSVELTKNPDAMISALEKVSGRAEVARAPAEVREMFLENAHASGFAGLLATHPPIDKRIEALKTYGGGLSYRADSA